MIGSLRGTVVDRPTAGEVVVEVGGVGYRVSVPTRVASVLGLAEPPRPPDVADALALAVCHLTTEPLRRAVAGAGQGR